MYYVSLFDIFLFQDITTCTDTYIDLIINGQEYKNIKSSYDVYNNKYFFGNYNLIPSVHVITLEDNNIDCNFCYSDGYLVSSVPVESLSFRLSNYGKDLDDCYFIIDERVSYEQHLDMLQKEGQNISFQLGNKTLSSTCKIATLPNANKEFYIGNPDILKAITPYWACCCYEGIEDNESNSEFAAFSYCYIYEDGDNDCYIVFCVKGKFIREAFEADLNDLYDEDASPITSIIYNEENLVETELPCVCCFDCLFEKSTQHDIEEYIQTVPAQIDENSLPENIIKVTEQGYGNHHEDYNRFSTVVNKIYKEIVGYGGVIELCYNEDTDETKTFKGSLRTACNPSDSVRVCYGNMETMTVVYKGQTYILNKHRSYDIYIWKFTSL